MLLIYLTVRSASIFECFAEYSVFSNPYFFFKLTYFLYIVRFAKSCYPDILSQGKGQLKSEQRIWKENDKEENKRKNWKIIVYH